MDGVGQLWLSVVCFEIFVSSMLILFWLLLFWVSSQLVQALYSLDWPLTKFMQQGRTLLVNRAGVLRGSDFLLCY